MSFTEEELLQLQDAWELLKRERPNLVDLYDQRVRASGGWPESPNYVNRIDASGIEMHHIRWDGDEGWEADTITFTVDELLNTEHETTKYRLVHETVQAERNAIAAQAAKEHKRKQYEALKKEFEGDDAVA